MRYRKLGKTNIEVSTVCMGCWAIVGDFTWGPQDTGDAVAAIRASLDAGVNFFDTAEGYGSGESEKILGEALADVRKDVVIATKVSGRHLAGGQVSKACEDSLQRLKTDYIDLYQIHWPRRSVPLSETFEAMEKLRSDGKIRCIGLSNFGVSYLRALDGIWRTESNQLCYSLLWRPVEHEVQPLCVAQEMSIICYSPLCQGLLTGKFATADDFPETRARMRLFSPDRPHCRHDEAGCEAELFEAIGEIKRICESAGISMTHASLAWLLAQPGVASVIAGARNAAQASQNAKAADLELPDGVADQLAAATEKVKAYAGTNCDLWQSESRMER